MNKELLIKLTRLIGSSLVISGQLMLTACDDKVEQTESKQLTNNAGPLINKTEPLTQSISKRLDFGKKTNKAKLSAINVNANKVSKGEVSIRKIKVEKNELDEVDGSALGSAEILTDEEEKQLEPIILDLSLNLDIVEKYYSRGRVKKKKLAGLFEFEKDSLNFDMEAHFEWPHNENKEREMTPDGVGVGIRVGI